jgi:excinuclease ABC subunit A
MYVLTSLHRPHQRDNDRPLSTLRTLRDIGNTADVVEHDQEGSVCGLRGGQVQSLVVGFTWSLLARWAGSTQPYSLTGQYSFSAAQHPMPPAQHPARGRWLRLIGARGNNLKGVTLELPLVCSCVTGVSVGDLRLSTTLSTRRWRTTSMAVLANPPLRQDQGPDTSTSVVSVDQSLSGARAPTPPLSGLFTPFANSSPAPLARERGYGPGRFSFNVKGGRCEACQGDGVLKVEMHFLPDIYVPCDVCHGRRYNRETLEIQYKGRNIHEVLEMRVGQAHQFFGAVPAIERKLHTLLDVGLGYIELGQSATTLSGGEAQRVKLSLELSKRDTGRTLYILDEHTTGLHFHDIELLQGVLHRLRDHGNSVVVIEHNLDVVKTADWIVDLGPEGGDGGGQIIAQGTPEQVAAHPTSYTGRYLKDALARSRKHSPRAAAAA